VAFAVETGLDGVGGEDMPHGRIRAVALVRLGIADLPPDIGLGIERRFFDRTSGEDRAAPLAIDGDFILRGGGVQRQTVDLLATGLLARQGG